ncbi:MAG: type II toxin-antitoxin system RelE/ParE family toxin [Cyclobacteriaceae bacterium]
MRYFETIFLEEAEDFIAALDPKTIKKVFYNIDLAEQTNDPKLFKKLEREIWEFRTKYLGNQIRLLAFWDKEDSTEVLVLATHGFIKKSDKVPRKELDKAVAIRAAYFKEKENKNSHG